MIDILGWTSTLASLIISRNGPRTMRSFSSTPVYLKEDLMVFPTEIAIGTHLLMPVALEII